MVALFARISEGSGKQFRNLNIHIVIVRLLSGQHWVKQFTLDGVSWDFILVKFTEMSG